MSSKIFSAYHLEAPLPSGTMIVPSEVGYKNRESHLILPYNDNSSLHSISDKNNLYSELSLQYAISQHCSKFDNIGLCHYRRLFNPLGLNYLYESGLLKEHSYEYGKNSRPEIKYTPELWDYITNDKYQSLLSDMIDNDNTVITLTPFEKTNKWSLWTLADIGWIPVLSIITFFELMQEILTENEFIIFDKAINQSNSHYCNNMIYCKSETFQKYTNWLMYILFEFENRLIKLEQKTNRKLIVPRMFGYFSEYMLKPWCELTEKNMKFVESICFTDLKFDERIKNN